MRQDIVSIKHAWNRKFGRAFDEDQRDVRIIPSPGGQGFFRVTYSQKLEGWYHSPRGKARYDKPGCFFCNKHDEYVHVRLIKTIHHLEVFFNLKFVMRNHLLIAPSEHRDDPATADVVTLQQLAMISGLSVFGNFRDSGASYPQHVHYQTLETEFPIVSQPGDILHRNTDMKVETVRYPVLAFRFSPYREIEWTPDGVRRAGQIITSQLGTFNLVFYGRDIYLIPRTKSVPCNTNGFKFAAPEVCGSIFIREKRLFDILDGDALVTALQDVCLPLHQPEARQYQDRLLTSLQETKP